MPLLQQAFTRLWAWFELSGGDVDKSMLMPLRGNSCLPSRDPFPRQEPLKDPVIPPLATT